MLKINRILFILFLISASYSQNAGDMKELMDSYKKLNAEQEANEAIKKSIKAENNLEEGPVKILIEPSDISRYYEQKIKVIKEDLSQLSRLLISTDSLPPLSSFGYNLFSLRDTIQFIDNANVSSNYILGYGDEIIISVWGQAEQHVRKTLERDGTVFIENVGLLYLGGKTQAVAKSYLISRFSKVYSSIKSNPQLTFLEFSIGKIKNINVSIAGHIKYPGNYVVNPSISISNILVIAGGIKETGTLRNIFLQRNNTIVDTIDLYPFITGVGVIYQPSLFDGDIIVIPPKGNIIALTGDVLSPAYYELNQTESISTLLNYNGLDSNLNKQLIISRRDSINQFVSKEGFDNTFFLNGDSLNVPYSYTSFKSISITVSNRPLIEIPFTSDLIFSHILNISSVDIRNIIKVDLLRFNPDSKVNQMILLDPFKDDNFKFKPNDHLSIHLSESFMQDQMIVIQGEINSPGSYPLINNNESLSSVINRAGGLKQNISIENVIIKRDTLRFGSSTGNLILTPGDTVIANSTLGTVKVVGEVHQPGNFEWIQNSSAKNYLSFAGGLTTYGDKKHIVYITPYGKATRVTTRSNDLILPGSTIRVSRKPLSEQNKNIDRVQQISSVIGSLVSIAILAQTSR